jgi:hypothetical protein
MTSIYKYTRKSDSPPLDWTGSPPALQMPLRGRLSSAAWVTLVGLFIILVVAAIAYIAVRSGVNGKSIQPSAITISE